MVDDQKGEITGLVTRGKGRPVSEAVIMIGDESPPHQDIAMMTGDDGTFSLLDLHPGHYTINVRIPNGVERTQDVQVEAGKKVRLDFSFEEGN